MFITSCLPFSFPFNKTYAVAVATEETTKKAAGGGVWYCPQLYHGVLRLLSWAGKERDSLLAWAALSKGQGLLPTRRRLWPVKWTHLLWKWTSFPQIRTWQTTSPQRTGNRTTLFLSLHFETSVQISLLHFCNRGSSYCVW
jgi:hypothetical protein